MEEIELPKTVDLRLIFDRINMIYRILFDINLINPVNLVNPVHSTV